tara:strand:+ start:4077 stop:4826 length:750 start_codon:yes stop_codon:yes gene_type:complete
MKHLIALAAAGAALATASPGQAQDEVDRFLEPGLQTGTRFKRAPETADQGEARGLQKRVAKCVYFRNKDASRELLAHSDMDRIDFDAFGQASDTLFEDLDVAECIGTVMRGSQYRMYMRIPYSTLRNLLAEEVYLQDNKVAVAIPANAPRDLENRYGYERLNPRTAALTLVGDCVTHSSVDDAHAFLESRPGSSDEEAMFDALAPTVVACHDTDEEEVALPISMIRQITADALWARSHYGAAAAQGATN